jgi:TonB family protein
VISDERSSSRALHARLTKCDAFCSRLMRSVMPVESKLLLVVYLLLLSDMTIAGEKSVERCRVPPKVIIENAAEQYLPPSTAMPPIGKVVLEFTVTTKGTIRDVLVVEPVDSRLERWAVEKSKKLRFEAVGKACRSRFTLESRIAGGGATHA